MKALYKLILNGTIIGGVAFMTAAAGCSDSTKTDNSTAGKSGSQAGSSSTAGGAGGETSTAGKASSNAGASMGGQAGGMGGAGGEATGPSLAKFCNTLSLIAGDAGGAGGAGGASAGGAGAGGAGAGSTDVTLVLEVGEGAEMVKFTAVSGTCSSADGDMCVGIPQGPQVPIIMYVKDDPTQILDEGTADIRPGGEYVLYTALDQSSLPIWAGAHLPAGTACQDVIYTDVASSAP
jgi:hypothetical protein